MRGLFADPKTDIIFKKIFGQKERQHLLLELLTSLLELDEAHRIVGLEYLSPEQPPSRAVGKLSILDVKCTDASGVRYVIEMQVLEVEAFQKRVVYNACKAYANQLEAGSGYPSLNDVIAVTICNFPLWPQSHGASGSTPQVPMLSRWRMQEQHCGATGLGEVQYVFLELPKYTAGDRPETTVERWAYFFREAQAFDSVPEVLSTGPYAEALQVARLSNLTIAEETEYERELMAEQALRALRGGVEVAERRGLERGLERGLAQGLEQGLEQGRAEGQEEGKMWGLRVAIEATCEVLDLELGAEERAELERASLPELEALHAALRRTRRWPTLER
jgi:predicted transposase/invertase (TIGR01784 family)